ncbi:neuropeptide FF receptor 2-like isoform X2 [Antedon mediterranea]|uniref:neuropeptide FF receptor 2-like isoform X2 n=1 Tax=Antedon mediterranea TaxID=105859 RepID=UPI003AF61E1E
MPSVTPAYFTTGEQDNSSFDYQTSAMYSYVTAHDKEPLPIHTILLKSISIAILIFLTVFGNTVVITIIVKNKQLRGTTYYYLLNLAVADITIAIFTEWTLLVHELKRYWIFGEFMCKFSTVFQGISIHVSILTLTIIAIDRYLAIVFPLKSRVTSRNGGAGIFILAVWLTAICVNIPLLLNTGYQEWTYPDGHYRAYCFEEWSNPKLPAIYTTVLFVVIYIAPMSLMIFVYLTIATKLLVSRAPGERIESTVSSQERTKRKYEPDNRILFACLWLGYANSALNPFIYCGFNENFRQGFLQILTCNSKKYIRVNKEQYSKKTYPSHTDKTIIEQGI